MSDVKVYVQNTAFFCNYKNVARCFVVLNKPAFKTAVHNLQYPCFELECFIASGSLLTHKNYQYVWHNDEKMFSSVVVDNGYFFTNWQEGC